MGDDFNSRPCLQCHDKDIIVNRVILCAGEIIRVFHFNKDTICFDQLYDTENKEKIESYFQRNPNLPTKILLDMFEEEFKEYSIPKISFTNKQTLLERQKNKIYRGLDYAYVEAQEPDPNKPKHQIILLSAITRQKQLKDFVKKILSYKTIIVGIWSCPHISVRLLPPLKATSGKVLLMTNHFSGRVRQTFFVDGKIKMSREIRFQSDKCDNILTEIKQFKKFLQNQRILGLEEKLIIHSFLPVESWEKLSENTENDLEIHSASIEKISRNLNIKLKTQTSCDEMLSTLVYREPFNKNLYGKTSDRRFFYQNILSQSIQASAFLLALIGISVTAINFSNAYQLSKSSEKIQITSNQLGMKYSKEFLPFETNLNKAEYMASAVLLKKKIAAENKINPIYFYQQFSSILSNPRFSNISIISINWQKSQSNTTLEITDDNVAAYENNNYDSNESYQDFEQKNDIDNNIPFSLLLGNLPLNPVKHEATIKAELPTFGRKYRSIIKDIENFINSIESHQDVLKVSILKLPIDTRSDSIYSDLKGKSLAPGENEKIEKSQFEFRVSMSSEINL